MFIARVTRTVSAAHHNGPHGNKCERNHGHDWGLEVFIAYDESQLDSYGWGPDFGKIKKVLDAFDHQDLNEVMKLPPSAENFAKTLIGDLEFALEGFLVAKITIAEGNNNFIDYYPHTEVLGIPTL